MRMDPFKILLMISIISSSRAAKPFNKGPTTCTHQRKVSPPDPDKWKPQWDDQSVSAETRARKWAWERVSRFVRTLQDWSKLQEENEEWKLMGGKADVHDKPGRSIRYIADFPSQNDSENHFQLGFPTTLKSRQYYYMQFYLHR